MEAGQGAVAFSQAAEAPESTGAGSGRLVNSCCKHLVYRHAHLGTNRYVWTDHRHLGLPRCQAGSKTHAAEVSGAATEQESPVGVRLRAQILPVQVVRWRRQHRKTPSES